MQTLCEIDIERPAAEVFAVLADFSQNPTWQDGMDRCAWTTEPPHGVGSRYDQVAHFMGREILTTFEVTELTADRVKIESRVSTFPIQVVRSVRPLGDGVCRVRAEISGQPPWYLRLPGMGWMMRRSIEADYRRLKVLLEGHGSQVRNRS